METVVVVVIMGSCAAIVTPKMMSRVDDAQKAKAETGHTCLRKIRLNLFRMDNYKYPTTRSGADGIGAAAC